MEAPVASSLSMSSNIATYSAVSSIEATNGAAELTSSVSLNLKTDQQPSQRTKLKGGLTLVFDPGMEGPEEESMEERRASLSRYKKMVDRASAKKVRPVS